jgi:hypothetical protein
MFGVGVAERQIVEFSLATRFDCSTGGGVP